MDPVLFSAISPKDWSCKKIFGDKGAVKGFNCLVHELKAFLFLKNLSFHIAKQIHF